jgi:hypothetical protein
MATCLHAFLMRCVLPPSEPPDGEHLCRSGLAVVGGTQLHGSWYLSAIAPLQGFSSCSPAAFPHQWAVWWREVSRTAASAPPLASRIFVTRAEAEGRTEWGVPPCGPVTLFFPRRLGEKGILQPRGGFLQPCRERRTAAAQPGCSIPSSVGAMVAPRTGRPCPGLPGADSHARGLPSTSGVARAALMFWGGLGEGGSEDLPVRFGAPDGRRCGVEVAAAGEGFSADEIAYSAYTPGPLSPGLNGWFSSFVGKGLSAAASARKPLLQLSCRPGRRLLPLLPERASASHQGFCRPVGPPTWGVVRTCGGGTGVLFVMAPGVPVFVHCGYRGLNM